MLPLSPRGGRANAVTEVAHASDVEPVRSQGDTPEDMPHVSAALGGVLPDPLLQVISEYAAPSGPVVDGPSLDRTILKVRACLNKVDYDKGCLEECGGGAPITVPIFAVQDKFIAALQEQNDRLVSFRFKQPFDRVPGQFSADACDSMLRASQACADRLNISDELALLRARFGTAQHGNWAASLSEQSEVVRDVIAHPELAPGHLSAEVHHAARGLAWVERAIVTANLRRAVNVDAKSFDVGQLIDAIALHLPSRTPSELLVLLAGPVVLKAIATDILGAGQEWEGLHLPAMPGLTQQARQEVLDRVIDNLNQQTCPRFFISIPFFPGMDLSRLQPAGLRTVVIRCDKSAQGTIMLPDPPSFDLQCTASGLVRGVSLLPSGKTLGTPEHDGRSIIG